MGTTHVLKPICYLLNLRSLRQLSLRSTEKCSKCCITTCYKFHPPRILRQLTLLTVVVTTIIIAAER